MARTKKLTTKSEVNNVVDEGRKIVGRMSVTRELTSEEIKKRMEVK